MSRAVFYSCETCDVSSDVHRNHGETELRAAWRVLPLVKSLMEHEANNHLGIEVQADSFWRLGNPWSFLLSHEGHEVVLRDEYGRSAPLDGEEECRP